MANPDNHLNYDVDEWVYGDTLQAGIGQSESLFTPLQLAEYCAALANGGTRYSASILKSVRSFDYSTQLYEKEAEVLNTVDSADYNFAAVQQGMYLLAHDVNSSSSVVYQAFNNYSYNGEYICVAAKTGTSQLGEGVTNNAIFMCYAPFDDPEIAVAIVVSPRLLRRQPDQHSQGRPGRLLQPGRQDLHRRQREHPAAVSHKNTAQDRTSRPVLSFLPAGCAGFRPVWTPRRPPFPQARLL